jgi:DNA-binding transcriptional ArsR family regulator
MDKPRQDIYELETLEQVRALTDPLRLRIAETLTDTPMTVTQLGQQFGTAPARIYYHLRELERVGLVELVETREKGGILEKYYQTVARNLIASASLKRTISSDDMIATLSQLLQQASLHFLKAAVLSQQEPEHGRKSVQLITKTHWLTDEQFQSLMDQISALFASLPNQPDGPDTHEREFLWLAHTAVDTAPEDAPS